MFEDLSPEPPPSAAIPWSRTWPYGLALLLSAVATLVAVATEQWVGAPNASLVFVVPVVALAVAFGIGPALTAATAGVLAFNFFLIEPRYTLRVNDPANIWALGLMLLVAGIVSAVAAQSRGRALEAREYARQAGALQALARALVAAPDRDAIVRATETGLHELFAAPAVVLLPDEGRLPDADSPQAGLSAGDLESAGWALAYDRPVRADVYPVREGGFDFWPVRARARVQAVLGVKLNGRAGGRPVEAERLVETVAGYVAVALERDAYAGHAVRAQLELEEERLKTDLLAAVSHDLRTPLSTILLTLQSLQRYDEAHGPEGRRDLLELAETETARLTQFVGDLLDMNRIEAGAIVVQLGPTSARALAEASVHRAGASLAGHRVQLLIEGDGPDLQIDGALAEAAVANVLQNAAKYSPQGSVIEVRAQVVGGEGELAVIDEGAGFPADLERVFSKFTRGVQGDGRPPGLGLGLAIVRGFVEAQGGAVRARNREEGPGAVVTFRFPLSTPQAGA